MSAETYRILEDAINAHVIDEAEEPVAIIRDWVLVAAPSSIDKVDDDHTEIVLFRAPHTSLYAVTGLLEWGKSVYGTVEL
jgi:hypothetical protein